jgi:hypothetical protein
MAPSSCSIKGHENGLFQKTFAYLLSQVAFRLMSMSGMPDVDYIKPALKAVSINHRKFL